MKNVVVKLENFSKSFGRKEVIKNIDLEVYEGEFLTILGASGCGKTTILRSISGLDMPTTGKVYLDGKDVTNLDPTKREVNTLFQNYALFPLMTVKQNIEFGLKMKKVPEEERNKRVKEMLKLVKLEGYEKRKPKELSGGEQQRVSIARGLVNKPKVLLLDEPLSALDLKLKKQTQIELKSLQKKLGITFIFVTHDQNAALTMSDRIMILHDGKIEQLDTPTNIYKYPKTVFVADFIGESNIFKGKVTLIKDGFAYVKITTGEEVKVKDKGFKLDEKVNVVVRPEHFKFPKRKTKNNCFEVTIKTHIYDGAITKILAEFENNNNIKINVSSSDSIPKVGEKIYISFDVKNAIALGDSNARK